MVSIAFGPLPARGRNSSRDECDRSFPGGPQSRKPRWERMVWRDLCDWRAGRVVASTCAYARIDRLSRRFRCHHGPVRRHAGRQRALSSRTHSYRPAAERGLCADPSLLAPAGALQGDQIDYASHFGGAIAGAAVGLVMLAVWSPREPWPGLRGVAATIAIAGVALLAYPAISVPHGYQNIAFSTKLVPSDELPQTNAEMSAHAT